ncbi:VRR-NUC domain-containing protein [bacterium]|nr:VRR-NUC domain-containing protein [bacterium]
MSKKIYVPIEDEEAFTFVDWLETLKLQGIVLDYCHIPNESYGGTWKDVLRGKKLKRMGRKKGVFDYEIFLKKPPREIRVELKRVKKYLSKVSQEQKEWQQVYTACGIPAAVCYGAGEAIEFVEGFI